MRDFIERFEMGEENYLPHISIDCVIFGLSDDALKVLLLKVKDTESWVLPGGYVEKDESIEDAALHILRDRTGLSNIYLQQFNTTGSSGRSFPEDIKVICKSLGVKWTPDLWANKRFISIGYYALIDIEKCKPTGGDLDQEYSWIDMHRLPRLMMDHKDILLKAYESLKISLSNQPVGINLLPEKFTMPELQKMYEIILDKSIERSHFQKKMLRFDIFERLEERREGVPHKRPFLYRFDEKKYRDGVKKGARFDV